MMMNYSSPIPQCCHFTTSCFAVYSLSISKNRLWFMTCPTTLALLGATTNWTFRLICFAKCFFFFLSFCWLFFVSDFPPQWLELSYLSPLFLVHSKADDLAFLMPSTIFIQYPFIHSLSYSEKSSNNMG